MKAIKRLLKRIPKKLLGGLIYLVLIIFVICFETDSLIEIEKFIEQPNNTKKIVLNVLKYLVYGGFVVFPAFWVKILLEKKLKKSFEERDTDLIEYQQNQHKLIEEYMSDIKEELSSKVEGHRRFFSSAVSSYEDKKNE